MSADNKPMTSDAALHWLTENEMSISRNKRGVISLRSDDVDGAIGVGVTVRAAVMDAFKRSPALLSDDTTASVLFMLAALDADGEQILDAIGAAWFHDEDTEDDDSEDGDSEDTDDDDSEDTEDDDSEEGDAPVRFARRT